MYLTTLVEWNKARKGIIFYGVAINYFHVAGGHGTRDKQLT
jgi:hypothetical protein